MEQVGCVRGLFVVVCVAVFDQKRGGDTPPVSPENTVYVSVKLSQTFPNLAVTLEDFRRTSGAGELGWIGRRSILHTQSVRLGE